MSGKELTLTDEDFKDFTLQEARTLYEAQVATHEQIMQSFQSCRELIREVERVNVRIEELCALRRKAVGPPLFSPQILAAVIVGGSAAALSIAFLVWLS